MAPCHSHITCKRVESADGQTIYAEAVGDSTKPSIVFLHGFALTAAIFDEIFVNKRLLDSFYLVRYDMRGHGRSCKPTSLDGHASELYAADFKAVIDAFGLIRPVFCGWSIAAAVITDICAHLKPLPIAGAIALGGSPCIGTVVPIFATPLLLKTLSRFSNNADVSEAIAARLDFVDAWFDEPEKVSHSLKCRYLGQTLLQTPDVSFCVTMRPQTPEKLYEAGQNGLPLLLLFGKTDQLIDGEAVRTLVKPHFNKLHTVFIRGSHAVFEVNEDETVDEIAKFVISVQ